MEQKDIDSKTANHILLIILCMVFGAVIVILLIKPDFFRVDFTAKPTVPMASKMKKSKYKSEDTNGIVSKDGFEYEIVDGYKHVHKTDRVIRVNKYGTFDHPYDGGVGARTLTSYVYEASKAECFVTEYNTYSCRVSFKVDGHEYNQNIGSKFTKIPMISKTGYVYFREIDVSISYEIDDNGNTITKEDFIPNFTTPIANCPSILSNVAQKQMGIDNIEFNESNEWFEIDLSNEKYINGYCSH